MLVSVIIGLYNEEKYLPRLIEDLKKQTYDLKKIELIFIDGMSTDKSFEIITHFKNSSSEFYNIMLLKNNKKILSAGMNIGIKEASGECMLKVDCHSHIPENFVLENVKTIQDEFVCGGPRPNIIENSSNFKNTLLAVEENIFGSGIASYRKSSEKKYVSSVFQGMYRREVFQKVGLFDELVGRVEDNEFHYRVREAGYKIRYNNEITSYQYTRPTYSKMLKQKYSNGYWIGLVSHKNRNIFSIFHYVPFIFVLALIFSIIFIPISNIFIFLLACSYSLVLVLITITSLLKNNFRFTDMLMPFLICGIHISYGIGTAIGLLKGFSWKKDYNKKSNIEYLKNSI